MPRGLHDAGDVDGAEHAAAVTRRPGRAALHVGAPRVDACRLGAVLSSSPPPPPRRRRRRRQRRGGRLRRAARRRAGRLLPRRLATGVYHWLVDNYGDADTPVLGPQIAAFQGHHRHPPPSRGGAVQQPARPGARRRARPPARRRLPSPRARRVRARLRRRVRGVRGAEPAVPRVGARQPATAAPGVGAMQRAGVLVSRAQHGAHHRAPYDNNYCIVSGMWNATLDRHRVFEAMEMVVFLRTGVRPRSWDEPDAAWTEDYDELPPSPAVTLR